MSSTDHEFKNLTLRDIRIFREKIQHFVDTTYSIAENAVQNLFSNDNHSDVLRNLDEMNTVLKECREKLITVANAIPDEIPHSPQVNQVAYESSIISQIQPICFTSILRIGKQQVLLCI